MPRKAIAGTLCSVRLGSLCAGSEWGCRLGSQAFPGVALLLQGVGRTQRVKTYRVGLACVRAHTGPEQVLEYQAALRNAQGGKDDSA